MYKYILTISRSSIKIIRSRSGSNEEMLHYLLWVLVLHQNMSRSSEGQGYSVSKAIEHRLIRFKGNNTAGDQA